MAAQGNSTVRRRLQHIKVGGDILAALIGYPHYRHGGMLLNSLIPDSVLQVVRGISCQLTARGCAMNLQWQIRGPLGRLRGQGMRHSRFSEQRHGADVLTIMEKIVCR
jgi:hypothetical protein